MLINDARIRAAGPNDAAEISTLSLGSFGAVDGADLRIVADSIGQRQRGPVRPRLNPPLAAIYPVPMGESRMLTTGSRVQVDGVDATVLTPMSPAAKHYNTGQQIISVYPLLFPSGEVRLFSRDAFEWDPDRD